MTQRSNPNAMVSFVWIERFLNINMFRQNISILPKLHFLAETESVKSIWLAQARVFQVIPFVFCGFHPLWRERTLTEPHSFFWPAIKKHVYFKRVVKWHMSLSWAVWSQDCGPGIYLRTHPVPSPAARAAPWGHIGPAHPEGARTKCLLLETSVTSARHSNRDDSWIEICISVSPPFTVSFFPRWKSLSRSWAARDNKPVTKGIACQSPERVKAAVGEVWGDVVLLDAWEVSWR